MNNVAGTIDHWIQALQQYSFVQLCAVPEKDSWSAGQLFNHLINDTRFYLQQARLAVSSDDNSNETAAAFAQTLFSNNAFPNQVIAGNPLNAFIPQPATKQQLTDDMNELKKEIIKLEQIIIKGSHKGKSRHPGLGYFSAVEWLQFADIHFRHHLRQKEKIDAFLKISFL
jgi:hypothetical protein